ncbi:hypothetical protein HYU22_01585 [Candidatus Woesearchaeota archaeon]|nr:hypothetical protein [Candidatus Woesearchaeota archaeon]
MTAIIVINLKKDKSVLVCADRQESGSLIDYNNISIKDMIDIGGEKYYPISIAERPIGVNQTEKIFQIENKYVFTGAGNSEYLEEVKKFCKINFKNRKLIQEIQKIIHISEIQFILIDINSLKINYFNKGSYSVYNDAVLIFGDVGEIQQKQDVLNQCIERYSSPELIFDQMVFVLHELSKNNYYKTIASPFCSGCNLFRIKNRKLNKYKIVNYFRWEND